VCIVWVMCAYEVKVPSLFEIELVGKVCEYASSSKNCPIL
jgi:hypothetical protein